MLYIQLLFAVGLLSAHLASSANIEDALAACGKTFGVDAGTALLNAKDPAFLEKNKCYLACVIEKRDGFKADGSIDKEKDKQLLQEEEKLTENLKKKYLKATDDCDGSAKADKCETAYEYIKCKETKVAGN
uniref:Odorant-binding protein 14 n=1 Tax=Eocanthecona furcellata TaxID=696902 RepID=A0AAT9TZ70_9HEMI